MENLLNEFLKWSWTTQVLVVLGLILCLAAVFCLLRNYFNYLVEKSDAEYQSWYDWYWREEWYNHYLLLREMDPRY
jgi:hypothetical protein